MRKKRIGLVNRLHKPTVSSFSASASSSVVRVRGMSMRRNPRIDLGYSNFRQKSEVDALGLPLGMSFAAFVAQVMV